MCFGFAPILFYSSTITEMYNMPHDTKSPCQHFLFTNFAENVGVFYFPATNKFEKFDLGTRDRYYNFLSNNIFDFLVLELASSNC